MASSGLIGPYLTPYEILKERYFDPWHSLLAASGRTDVQMCHNEFVYVGESEKEVKDDVRDYVMWYIRKAARIWGERDRSKVAKQYANYNDVLEYFDTVEFDEVFDKLAIFGTPDQVAEKIRWMRDEGGCNYLMNFMWFGGFSHEKAKRNMQLFAEEVMPPVPWMTPFRLLAAWRSAPRDGHPARYGHQPQLQPQWHHAAVAIGALPRPAGA